jgi:hypothetical protein
MVGMEMIIAGSVTRQSFWTVRDMTVYAITVLYSCASLCVTDSLRS